MSKIIKLARVFQGLTQAEVASKLGLSKSYVSEIESGKRSINLQTLRRYATLLGIPASSLLFFMERFENDDYVAVETGSLQASALKLFSWLQTNAGIKDPDEDSSALASSEDSEV